MVLSRSDTEPASRIDFWYLADHLDLGLLMPMKYTKGIWETWLRLVHYFGEGWDLPLLIFTIPWSPSPIYLEHSKIL